MISTGRVKVNDGIASLGQSVTQKDRVLLDERPVELPLEHAYFALNKPKGYLTTMEDERGRLAVANLMPRMPGLVPVGRLDAWTSGLLLLTNDGRLAHHVAHPSSKIEKEYELTLRNPVFEESLTTLAKGPMLQDGPMLPSRLSRIRRRKNRTTLNLTIHEGRNRVIRRACTAVGLDLISLRRVRVGPIRLGSLSEGCYRPLTEEELKALGRELT
jgi:23S rRNA pseudouridine2605 synthase